MKIIRKPSIGIIGRSINESDTMIQHMQKTVYTNDNLAKCLTHLLLRLKHYGFPIDDFYCFDGFCIAKSKNSFVLSPDGHIFKCLSLVGREEYTVSDIFTSNPKTDLENYFLENTYALCLQRQCEFLPICHSGCRFDAIVENGTMESPACKYDLYRKVNTVLLQELAREA